MRVVQEPQSAQAGPAAARLSDRCCSSRGCSICARTALPKCARRARQTRWAATKTIQTRQPNLSHAEEASPSPSAPQAAPRPQCPPADPPTRRHKPAVRRVRMHSPESPDAESRCAPNSGAVEPLLARQTISPFSLQRNRRAGCARGQAGLLHHFVQHDLERQVRGKFRRQSAPALRRKARRQIGKVGFERGIARPAAKHTGSARNGFQRIRSRHRRWWHNRGGAKARLSACSGVSPENSGLSIRLSGHKVSSQFPVLSSQQPRRQGL